MAGGILAAAWQFLISSFVELWLGVALSLFVLVLLGSCYCAGWIAAVRVPDERRKKEVRKMALLALFFQIGIIPFVGFMTFVLIDRFI